MSQTIGPPPINTPMQLRGQLSPEWRQWFTSVATAQNATAAQVAAQSKGSTSGS